MAIRALLTPELKGRLTDTVRRALGFARVAPDPFVVMEAHIDLTLVDSELVSSLLSLGFEPDNFAKIQPPQYVRHFTLQYLCSKSMPARSAAYQTVLAAAGGAARLIDLHAVAVGYVEVEVYTGEYAASLPFRPLAQDSFRSFPFHERSFQIDPVPTTETEAVESSLGLYARRAADIHAKVPGPSKPEARLEGYERSLNEMRSLLCGLGFYEIRSEADNYMYSAHFTTLEDANLVYEGLVRFGREQGGLSGVAREICTSMWRKQVQVSGVGTVAEVPPHLQLIDAPAA